MSYHVQHYLLYLFIVCVVYCVCMSVFLSVLGRQGQMAALKGGTSQLLASPGHSRHSDHCAGSLQQPWWPLCCGSHGCVRGLR